VPCRQSFTSAVASTIATTTAIFTQRCRDSIPQPFPLASLTQGWTSHRPVAADRRRMRPPHRPATRAATDPGAASRHRCLSPPTCSCRPRSAPPRCRITSGGAGGRRTTTVPHQGQCHTPTVPLRPLGGPTSKPARVAALRRSRGSRCRASRPHCGPPQIRASEGQIQP
jgi:hypothetical protein